MSEDAKLPLEGLRVVDAADGAGELCGRMLADFGADVVRVEPPEGAASRKMKPLSPDGSSSLYFAFRNSNKRGITLDLGTSAGKNDLFRLLKGADIYLHSMRPKETEGTDIAPDALCEKFPHLIVTSITGFGQTGTYADFEPTPDVIFAMSGWLSGSGLPEKPPLLMPGPQAYDFAGVIGAFAILCALIQRRATGLGQHLDVSALESIAQCNTWQLPNASVTLAAGLDQVTLRSGTSPVYPLFETKDGYARPVILSPHQWKAFWEWLGEPEAFAAPEWGETLFRMLNLDVLNPVLAEHFTKFTMEEVAKEGQRRGIVIVPMLKANDVLANEHYESRDTFCDGEVTPGETARFVDGFMEISKQRLGYRFRAPALGEHTAEVLSEDWGECEFETDTPSVAESGTQAGGSSAQLPLKGMRVMDFGHGGVGVEAGRMLGEYGAEVIKIETRTYPDFIRVMLSTEMNGSFASSNRSKKSFGVNLRTPEGCRILHRMAETSDIVIENNSTGTMNKMGLGWEHLNETNPEIVLTSSQMMGSHGEYGGWIGYGPTIQTVGGLTWLWNFEDGDPPPGSPAIHPDHLAGRLAAVASLLGIWQRFETQQGFHAEQAQVENMMCLLGDTFMQESLWPGTVKPMGNFSQQGAPWGVFPCEGEDKWAVICVRTDEEWQALKDIMGNPAWAEDAAYASFDSRLSRREELYEKVSEFTASRSPQEVMSLCQAKGVPAGAMLNILDQMADPHLQARGFMVEIPHHDLNYTDKITMDGPAFAASRMAGPDIFQAPRLGQNTVELCREMGMGDEEIENLVEAGILELTQPEMQAREAAAKNV